MLRLVTACLYCVYDDSVVRGSVNEVILIRVEVVAEEEVGVEEKS